MAQALIASMARTAGTVAMTFMTVTVFTETVAVPSIVVGRSMYPTLNPDPSSTVPDVVLVTRTKQKDVRVGDIVCCKAPFDPDTILIKRVRAVPGDTVRTQLRNGTDVVGQVPRGRVWLEGDNGPESRDSRDFGCVPVGLVLGTARCVVFPPNRMRGLSRGGGRSVDEATKGMDEVWGDAMG